MGLRSLKLSPEQKKREGQWREDRQRVAINGRRLWRCWHCDSLSPWTDDHVAYYSYRELDDGVPFPIACSAHCKRALQNSGIMSQEVA